LKKPETKKPQALNNPMQEFSPYQVYQRVLRRWWVVVVCVLAGGSAGLLVHSLRPAIYEAEATLHVSLDFPPDAGWTQYEEDYAFGISAGLIDPIFLADRVVESLSGRGFSLTSQEFIQQASLERKQSTWVLRVRYENAELASQAALDWASLGYETLVETRDHAIQTAWLSGQMRDLLSCSIFAMISPRRPSAQPPQGLLGACQAASMEPISKQLASTSDQFRQELSLSQGISPHLLLDLPGEGGVSVTRVAFDRNLLTLAGALLGFVAGTWLVNLLPAARGRRG
jgi:hypothetical protein